MLADKRYCYPLTISDFVSRYLIGCEALSTTQEVYAFTVFERVFKEFGLPKAIRTGSAKVTSFDGYVFVAPEYNHGCRPEVLRV